MAIMRPETVVLSALLSDLPDVPAAQQQAVGSSLLRALGLVKRETDTDFTASLDGGFTESLADFDARLFPRGTRNA
jgi:hypothetical protein